MTIEEIKQHASELCKDMDYLKLEDGTTRVIIKDNAVNHEELIDITFTVSKKTSLSTDSVYQFTMDALSTIADSNAETEDDLRESIYDMQPDSYTSNLTEWLNESNYHVEYLTEILEEFSPKNGFDLLAMAQQRAMEEVGSIVLEQLLKIDE